MTTDRSRRPRPPPEIGGIGHSRAAPRGRPASSRARATTSTTTCCPGMLHMAILRSPVAHARINEHRHVGGGRARRRRRRRHRRAARAAQPRVDADAVGRHAGRARHRQGAVPGPGGRGGGRHRPLHRRGRARADRRRLRDPARHHDARSRRWPTARCSSATRRRARPTTSSTSGRRATPPRPTPRSPRPTGSSSLETLYPRSHPAPLETCGMPRRRQLGHRPGDDLHDVAGAARAPHGVRDGRRAARAEHPDHQPRHRRRLRQQGADVPGLRRGDRGVAA